LIFGGVCLAVIILIVPSNPSNIERGTGPFLSQLRMYDYAGSLLSVGAFSAWTIAISFGGVIYAWDSSRIIGLFVGSVVMFILFVIQQIFCIATDTENRLLPIDLFGREMSILFAEASAGINILYIPVYFLPLYYQFVRGDNALDSGARKLPHVGAAVFGIILSSVLFKKFRLFGAWFGIGTGITLIGSGLMSMLDTSTSNAEVYGYTVIMGFGTGLFAQLAMPAAQELIPAHRLMDATTMIALGQSTSALWGTNPVITIFVNLAANRIGNILPDVAQDKIDSLVAGVSSEAIRELDSETRERVIAALVESLRDIFIYGAAICAFGFVISFGMRQMRPPPSKVESSSTVA
jgi:hypothetical protein